MMGPGVWRGETPLRNSARVWIGGVGGTEGNRKKGKAIGGEKCSETFRKNYRRRIHFKEGTRRDSATEGDNV